MTGRRLVIGLGAQRAGSTWLADYLASHPEAAVSPIKEVHFFDSRHAPLQRGAIRARRRLRRSLRTLLAEARRSPLRGLRLLVAWFGMLAYRDIAYRAYMNALAPDGARVAVEITPAYALLPEAAWRRIDADFGRPLYVYVMRNPADRLLSQHQLFADAGLTRDADPEALLADPAFADRSNYRGALERLWAAVGRERVRVIFFERMIGPDSAEECAALCAFLGLSLHPPAPGKRLNRARGAPAPGWRRETAVRLLADQYRFAAEIAPADLPESWRRDLAAIESGRS